jgi:hypothetical protein
MKKTFLITLILLFAIVSVSAQKTETVPELTEAQWDELITSLATEKWTTAYDLSTQYIKLLKNNDEAKSIGNLRYMALYSAAGKVGAGDMTFEDLEKFVKDFVGKKVVLPFREIKAKCNGELNFICPSESEKNKAITAATNVAGTTIHAFEYVQFKEDPNFAKHNGEMVSIGGVVQSIVPNPNKSKFLVMRIYLSDGFLIPMKAPEKATDKKDLG